MRITVDGGKCAGHAQCHAVAPDVFELDEVGYAVPFAGEAPPGLEEQAGRGADACPEGAITIEN
ncbi:ferredoxin [Pseudonocardia kunmingensis]|uniref:Ferredoxin n=1 Tax=Pseudonocardia kunmingensis TaxID=630975 RepID=A0A543DPR1_9PSEU|nr:ferredoxin [Pseudonocardia kunmingensis]TQM11321.1 ferredoxin [Pseudonocardia kunmingensis]